MQRVLVEEIDDSVDVVRRSYQSEAKGCSASSVLAHSMLGK